MGFSGEIGGFRDWAKQGLGSGGRRGCWGQLKQGAGWGRDRRGLLQKASCTTSYSPHIELLEGVKHELKEAFQKRPLQELALYYKTSLKPEAFEVPGLARLPPYQKAFKVWNPEQRALKEDLKKEGGRHCKA